MMLENNIKLEFEDEVLPWDRFEMVVFLQNNRSP